MVRHAELKEQAESLPQGSAGRKTLEKRISHLEQYRLPKEDERDAEQREDVFDESGKKIGDRHSVRKRMIERRRGRPQEFTIKTRAAYEEKFAHPEKPWRVIADPVRTQGCLGIAPRGTALERSAEECPPPPPPPQVGGDSSC